MSTDPQLNKISVPRDHTFTMFANNDVPHGNFYERYEKLADLLDVIYNQQTIRKKYEESKDNKDCNS